jgi:hypothetical protein
MPQRCLASITNKLKHLQGTLDSNPCLSAIRSPIIPLQFGSYTPDLPRPARRRQASNTMAVPSSAAPAGSGTSLIVIFQAPTPTGPGSYATMRPDWLQGSPGWSRQGSPGSKLPMGIMSAWSGAVDGKSTVFGNAKAEKGPALPRTLTSTPQVPSSRQG